MDPITLALMGGTAISSIMGGMSADKANQQNADISMLNYYAQEEARRQAIAESRRQQSDAKLGTTDAAGNRVQFVPGVGWVTTLSDDQQAIQQGTEDEQLRQLVEGAGRAERVDARANSSRNLESDRAREAGREFGAVTRGDQDALRQLLLARGAETRNDSADRAGEATARQSIRGGGGFDAAELMAMSRGQSDAKAAQRDGVNAEIQSRGMIDDEFNNQRNAANGLYDYFRRASTSGTNAPTGYMPTGPQRSSTGVADQGIINALRDTPMQDYQSPNNAWASTIGDLAGLGVGYMQQRKTDQYNNDLLKAFSNRGLNNTGAA